MGRRSTTMDPARAAQLISAAMKRYVLSEGINGAEMSRRCGVPRPDTYKYMRGQTIPNPETLSKIAETMGTTPAGLLEGDFNNTVICSLRAVLKDITDLNPPASTLLLLEQTIDRIEEERFL